jgi:8-oxo-dGTP pyrophosphatase MutT (NUDIX family)
LKVAEVAEARPSSTVVLARDSADAPEFLLVRRHAKAAFGSTFAFPGGVLERVDATVHARCTGRHTDQADQLLNLDADGLDYYSAAARELFEEAGVLLADCTVDGQVLHRRRHQLNAGEIDWPDFLAELGLGIRCDLLHYFSHWITPATLPRRYTTRFFAAKLPHGQVACHDHVELTDSRWMTARVALDTAARGEIELPFPTLRTLEAMAALASVDALLDWADDRARAGVQPIQPEMPNGDPRARPVIVGERRS